MPAIAATSHHADALAAIHAAAFPPPEQWPAAAFAAQLALPATFGLIHPGGALVLARTAADEAEILTLAVAPAARRRGLARALLTQALHQAAARGATACLLEVAETNAPALALYRAAGFHPVGRRPRYYASGADALVLRAPLAGPSRP